MRILAGTSGYSYKEWRGSFYPPDAKPENMLRLYAARLGTVEINNTFYRMPSEQVLLGWAAQVPEGFSFVLKASRRITHQQRMQGSGDTLAYLLQTSAVLGAKRGPLLFQFPPDFALDLPRLVAFLGSLPAGWPAAFEFRHDSWRDERVHEALRARGAGLVVADTDAGDPPPVVATASFGYLRLRRARYGDGDLRAWLERIAGQPWERAYVFFKHEDEGSGPELAQRFVELAAGRTGGPAVE